MKRKKLAAFCGAMACAAVLCGCTVNINVGGEVEKLPSAAAEATAPVETAATVETTAAMETTAVVETTQPAILTPPPTQAAAQEPIPVELCQMEGYSLYIPKDLWQSIPSMPGEELWDVWQSLTDSETYFSVARIPTGKLTEAQDWIKEKFREYTLTEQPDGGFTARLADGESGFGDKILEIAFQSDGNTTFALVQECRELMWEQMDQELAVMADSFRFLQEE